MITKGSSKSLDVVKELHLLVFAIDQKYYDKIIELLHENRVHIQFVCNAQEVYGSNVMDFIGLEENEKKIIFCFVPNKLITKLLACLHFYQLFDDKSTLNDIAFSIPITGMFSPAIFDDKMQEEWQKVMESEADQVNLTINHDLIVAIVDEGDCDMIMDAAKTAGVKEGLTFHTLQIGTEAIEKILGFPIHEKKDVVAILALRQNKMKIIETIKKVNKTNSSNVIFTLPADDVYGHD